MRGIKSSGCQICSSSKYFVLFPWKEVTMNQIFNNEYTCTCIRKWVKWLKNTGKIYFIKEDNRIELHLTNSIYPENQLMSNIH